MKKLDEKLNILVVDDNFADLVLIEEALKSSDLKDEMKIQCASDGHEALEILRNPAKKFDIMLLDLNLPKISGQEILRIVKSDERLKNLPVLIFTSSSYDKDVQEAYTLHANGYLIKPLEYREFVELIKKIKKFWISIASLPTS